MKAILVIDMPDSYAEKYNTNEMYVWDITVQGKDGHEMFRLTTDSPSRLKPMPQKLDANDWHRMFSGLFSEREAKGYGWNACLKEIEE